ncbi:GTP cyclohydrolase FolE2 [Virgibacillus sp. C22-A2]|uniref:GTP cyclohydrolase FolE2 n=1 Tax=Virgibacillus tibetensis TaxID=3042313 RepID=A0ABU6KBW5_9BACI|nr:GTP cyclohydrolase FolE2 [Virgibacillus sp. C22-A2]
MNKTKTFPLKQLPNKEQRHKLFGSVMPIEKTKPVEKNKMADLQNVKRDFLFDLDAVGVSNVKHPITVYSKLKPATQTTIGTFYFASSLNNTSKGTNMSRFTEQLNHYHTKGFISDFTSLKSFTEELAVRLEQKDATLEVTFPWFYERKAPQSGLGGMNHAEVTMKVVYEKDKGFTLSASLSVLITTLCPCSKEISEYSAHNQRGRVTMEVSFTDDYDDTIVDWKEALLDAAESNASARLHPVLKRPDEKMITEQAYENPRFVEDMVRLVAADLYEMTDITKFKVYCRNEESIHMHDAIASVSYDKLNYDFK